MEHRKTDIFGGIATTILAAILACAGYAINRELQHIDTNFTGVQASIEDFKQTNNAAHEKLWQVISLYQKQVQCLETNLARCCPTAPNCI